MKDIKNCECCHQPLNAPISYEECVNIMNKDSERLKISLTGKQVWDIVVVDSPEICIKTTKERFTLDYCTLVTAFRNKILKIADGRQFVISEIKAKVLEDADKNFWGDYAKFKAEVVILK